MINSLILRAPTFRAIVLIAATGLGATGLAAPAFAANPPDYGPQFYAPSQSGGGSYGYNRLLLTHRLKRHHSSHHTQ